MNVKQTAVVILMALLSITLAVSSASAQGKSQGGKEGDRYTLVPLPGIQGDTNLDGYAERLHELTDGSGNLLGMEVIGILDGRAHYWMLDSAGAVVDVSPLPLSVDADPTTLSDAKGINGAGVIVGGAGVWPDIQPVVWASTEDEPIGLPVFDGFDGGGYGIRINNHGLIVGWLNGSDGTQYDVAWGLKVDGTIVGPALIAVADVLSAPDVNDAGALVATVDYQAHRWQVNWDGQSLGVSAPEILTAEILDENGVPQTITLPRIYAINEHGDVCGNYFAASGWLQSYLLSAEGLFIGMLPALVDNKRRGTANHHAFDLNDATSLDAIQVVGQAYIYDKRSNVVVEPDTAVFWQGNRETDLQAATDQPDSQLYLKHFYSISDSGWLAGFGWPAGTSDPRAIVLVPK